ncbi:hypothetical protein [Methylobacterium frigidaeris]|uniref:Uncharacterized protein n=1 Tax=Methylobacterium frigidaeris TaxID=2038277 RepID=A0AA37HD35_9HYPH|nr:hypothetical protein [Methylobacterium frigidaeris]GJD63768.1 hypothetical protein MPEAHAMD_3939 [Methylobacterium frigidaeris]
MRGAKPGERRGGRKKGTPNKTTADVKASILSAFEKAGGVDYLAKIADEDPKTFCALLGKVIPLQVTGDADNPVAVAFTFKLDRPKQS